MREAEMKGEIDSAYQSTLQELYGLGKFGIKLGLNNISSLLQDLDNPHQQWPSIHVAGSNGKGSTAAFLDAALRAAGHRVALYTSPHLVDFRERIRVDGKPISNEKVVQLWQQIRPRVRELRATFFEAVTAMAFSHFRAEKVHIAVVEVGLGGRLDATNVLIPELCVITSIAQEHTQWLGTALEQIACEKAGIVKQGSTVICGQVPGGPLDVIQRACKREQASLHLVDGELRWRVQQADLEGSALEVRSKKENYGLMHLGLAGKHQVRNGLTALLALETLGARGWEMPKGAIEEGFRTVLWPGRLQIVDDSPMVLLDVAHNPAGTKALSDALRSFLPRRRIHFVFGVQEEKEYRTMIGQLVPLAEEFFLTQAQWKGAARPEELAQEARAAEVPFQVYPQVKEAVSAALDQAGPQDVVCITGSHYVVGEAMEALGVRPLIGDRDS